MASFYEIFLSKHGKDVEEKKAFSRQARIDLNAQDRIKLVRKANSLFNQGYINDAERIFLTVRYTDGLRRLGDHYRQQKDFVQALKMYYYARSESSMNKLAQEIAEVLRLWMG